jgi:hypothetical protein
MTEGIIGTIGLTSGHGTRVKGTATTTVLPAPGERQEKMAKYKFMK